MLRVAVLSPEYPPGLHGGLGRHVGALTHALAGQASFEVFVPEGGPERRPDAHVRLHDVPSGSSGDHQAFWLGYCRGAVRAAASAAVDLVHAHEWMTAPAAVRLRRALGRRLVFNVHLPQTAPFHLAMEDLGLAHADLVLVNSQAVKDELLARDVAVGEVAVVPNGVDVETFSPAPEPGSASGLVLFVGRLAPQKGCDTLLRAFAILQRRCPSSRLVVVGDGDQELYLLRLARQLRVADRVEFLGWRDDPDLVELYRRAAVVAVPSRYEPFGLVALEAMACGCPVVACRVGGLQDVVRDDETGYLVPPGDYLELARRLAGVLLDDALRARLAEGARERAAELTWERAGAATIDVYRRLAGAAGEPPRRADGRASARLLRAVEPHLRPLARELVEGL
jgi:glycogen synthase